MSFFNSESSEHITAEMNKNNITFKDGFAVNPQRYPPLRFHENLNPPPTTIEQDFEIDSMKKAILFQYLFNANGHIRNNGYETLRALNVLSKLEASRSNSALRWDPLNEIYYPTVENVFVPPSRNEKLAADEHTLIRIIRGEY